MARWSQLYRGGAFSSPAAASWPVPAAACCWPPCAGFLRREKMQPMAAPPPPARPGGRGLGGREHAPAPPRSLPVPPPPVSRSDGDTSRFHTQHAPPIHPPRQSPGGPGRPRSCSKSLSLAAGRTALPVRDTAGPAAAALLPFPSGPRREAPPAPRAPARAGWEPTGNPRLCAVLCERLGGLFTCVLV